MHISNLYLNNFRNYDDMEISFISGLNFIVGLNGVGKTNILEAIYILANIKSFKNISDSDLIKWGKENYYCRCNVDNSEYNEFELGFYNNKKKAKINGKEIRRSNEYFFKLYTVIFTPEDSNIISGSSEIKRKYFDSVLAKIDEEYYIELNKFKKILSERNRLIKKYKLSKEIDYKELDVWDDLFADYSVRIILKRENFLDEFNYIFSNIYSELVENKIHIEIEYKSKLLKMNKEQIKNLLKDNIKIDVKNGSTIIGPQRDEYIYYNKEKINFNSFGSQGQKRLAAIALKKSELDLFEKIYGKKAIILIDDIFSEIDEFKRKNLINLLLNKNQVIFTMVNDSIIKDMNIDNYKIFKVEENGVIKSEF